MKDFYLIFWIRIWSKNYEKFNYVHYYFKGAFYNFYEELFLTCDRKQNTIAILLISEA